jgi:type II secretory pathway pseudopilin PulG
MSEALLGALVGGLLASIVPVFTLFTDSRRWRHEKKLDYLASERSRLEALFSKTLENLSDAMAKNSYPSQMTSDILVLMPKSIGDRFEAWMKEKPKDELKARNAYLDICLAMKKVLADVDAKITGLIHD